MRYNFALHFVQFVYHFKERLSFIYCVYVWQIIVGSWMSFGIYLDKSIYMGMDIIDPHIWVLSLLVHPSLWACMASSISEPWHTCYSETISSHGFKLLLLSISYGARSLKVRNKLPDYHNVSNRATASASSFRACGALDNRGYLCSWLYLTFLYLLAY